MHFDENSNWNRLFCRILNDTFKVKRLNITIFCSFCSNNSTQTLICTYKSFCGCVVDVIKYLHCLTCSLFFYEIQIYIKIKISIRDKKLL